MMTAMNNVDFQDVNAGEVAIGAGVGAGINLISQGINIARGNRKNLMLVLFLEVLLKAELLQE